MILRFTGEYDFLSNFYPSKIEHEGITYNTVEAAFQAQKTGLIEERIYISTLTPEKAKRYGRKVALVEDWDKLKFNIMLELVRKKFRVSEELKNKLLSTGKQRIVEGNNWHDNYWGACSCERCGADQLKMNWLGEILMKVREELSQ